MELGFGTEIRLKLSGRYGEEIWKRFLTMVWKLDDNKYRFVGERGWIDQNDLLWHKDSFEILGRLPTLADVLHAIGVRGNGREEPNYFVTDAGLIGWKYSNGALDNNGLIWDLSLPFDQQDEVAISFIYELLK